MSYILDALKKNQTEQAGDGVALRVQSNPSSHVTRSVLVYVLVMVVLVNLGLLGWIFKDQLLPVADVQEVDASIPAPANGVISENNDTQTVSTPPTQGETNINRRDPEPPTPVLREAETQATSTPPTTAAPANSPPVNPRPVKATPTRTPIALTDLPTGEQVIYREFNYSSHIYTDDPTLCAIVIDGQRLKAGDAFKGLKIHAVTESGVIFDETRRGVSRLIEVSIFELWDS